MFSHQITKKLAIKWKIPDIKEDLLHQATALAQDHLQIMTVQALPQRIMERDMVERNMTIAMIMIIMILLTGKLNK